MAGRMRRYARLVLVLLVVGSVAGGCAYFNLFYNAEKAFSEAEALGREVDPRNQPTSQQRQQYTRAIRKCRMLIDEYPESDLVDDALFLMGKSHLRLAEYSDAIRNFDIVMTNFSDSEFVEESLYLKSLAHLGRGEEEVGLEWFARLRESYPEGRFGAEALFRLGDAYAEDGKSDQAIAYYREFLTLYPKRPERSRVLLSLARVQFDAERLDDAIATLEDFDPSQVSPESAFEAEYLRVNALLEAGRAEEAEPLLADLELSATNDNDRDQIELLQGRVLLSLGRSEEGMKAMQDLARDRAGQPVASEALGLMVDYTARAMGPQSEELEAAIAATEGVRVGGNWGQMVRDRRAQVDRYRVLRERVDAADSTSANAAFDLAEMMLFDFDRPDDAVTWYQQVLELDPESSLAPRAAYALGWIQAEVLDQPEVAAQTFANLEARYPDSLQARALAGEQFDTAKERTREEIEAMLASGGTGVGPSGGDGISGGGRPGDPRFAAGRGLRYGGPGAMSAREAATR